MNKFMLILHEDPSAFAEVSPEEMQQVVEKYGAWAQALAERGQHAGGNKLVDEGGRWLTGTGAQLTAVDGPFTEAKEVVGGYFLVLADDMAAAESIAMECPHLEFGGRIELRQIEDTPGNLE
jgi:hypothetical protein